MITGNGSDSVLQVLDIERLLLLWSENFRGRFIINRSIKGLSQ